jgi:hypothetical protein
MGKQSKKHKEYLFVDGYNIINSWGNLKELSKLSLEVAREGLIEIMSEYQIYSGIKTIIVFDAHLVKGNSGLAENFNGLQVIYTKENETADQYIEKTLDEIGRVEKVRVATSDWLEQQIILGRGGTRISARELEIEILEQKKTIKRKKKKKNAQEKILMGRLDDEILKKLNKWGEKQE